MAEVSKILWTCRHWSITNSHDTKTDFSLHAYTAGAINRTIAKRCRWLIKLHTKSPTFVSLYAAYFVIIRGTWSGIHNVLLRLHAFSGELRLIILSFVLRSSYLASAVYLSSSLR